MSILKHILLSAVMATTGLTNAYAKDMQKIGVTLGSLGNPFFVVVAKGIEDEAKKINPNAEIQSLGADYDISKQFSQIDNFISLGVDLIVINAVDSVGMAQGIQKAQKAGIVVVALGEMIKGADAYIGIDNKQAGERTCQYMVDKLGGKGNVIIVNGPQVSAVMDRVEGCKEVLANAPDIKLLSFDQNGKASRDGGYDVTQGLLTRFPEINGIFGMNDPVAIGASLAAKNLKYDNLVIVGVDGSPDIEAALKDPTSMIYASGIQDPYAMGAGAVDIGNKILQGSAPEQRDVFMESKVITRDNVNEYKGWTAPR
jgi:ribose transport system substrate-binding protein